MNKYVNTTSLNHLILITNFHISHKPEITIFSKSKIRAMWHSFFKKRLFEINFWHGPSFANDISIHQVVLIFFSDLYVLCHLCPIQYPIPFWHYPTREKINRTYATGPRTPICKKQTWGKHTDPVPTFFCPGGSSARSPCRLGSQDALTRGSLTSLYLPWPLFAESQTSDWLTIPYLSQGICRDSRPSPTPTRVWFSASKEELNHLPFQSAPRWVHSSPFKKTTQVGTTHPLVPTRTLPLSVPVTAGRAAKV